MTGVYAEAVDNGYIILCNETAKGFQRSVIIQTDNNGAKIAPDIILPDLTASNLFVGQDGYYVVGDSIKNDLQASIYSAVLLKVNPSGNIANKLVLANRSDTTTTINFHGNAVTANSQNDLIMLGTYKKGIQTEKPYLIAVDAASFDTLWQKNYDVIERDYINAKNVHITPSGHILWASALLKGNQTFSESYLGVPYIKENSTFENFSQFGELSDQQLYPRDICSAAASAFGYAIVGTFESSSGGNPNIFFIRVDQFGTILQGSDRYFDGAKLGTDNASVTSDESVSDDTGDAIIATRDGGFVLGGSMKTTTFRGNGGTDILLIKVDGHGNVLWNKIFGGSGNETISSIRETNDGGLLICGSNELSGLSSAFLMKTDKNGELTD